MYRLREMDIDDKVCEQVDMALLAQVYPKEEIEKCVAESQHWGSKARRVRQSAALALVWFVMAMALWSRLSQSLVWQKLVGKRSSLHPGEPKSDLSASALSGRREELGSTCLQALMQARCQVIAQRQQMRSRLLWSLPTHGHRRDGVQYPGYHRQRDGVWSQQQSIWERSLSAGALCVVGRVWEPCGGGSEDEPL